MTLCTPLPGASMEARRHFAILHLFHSNSVEQAALVPPNRHGGALVTSWGNKGLSGESKGTWGLRKC